jgi:cytochrome c-type biogenesis protein CcmH/NrfG
MKSEHIDMFDEYFSGMLDEQEKLDFENRLKADIKYDQAFQEYRDLRNGIDYSVMKTLKEELQELEATLPEVQIEPQVQALSEEPKVGQRFVLLKVAAVVMLIAVSAVVVFQLNRPSSPQDLFTQHFEPYPNEFVSAKRGDDIAADPIVQAFQAYDNQNYNAAIEGFTRILDEEKNVMVLFYLGSAQLAQNQSQSAIATFERFLEISEDSVTEAKWYLALSYLKEARAEEARVLLEEIKEDDEYGKQATRILRRLR